MADAFESAGGRARFLEKYKFGPSPSYWLGHHGKQYDSQGHHRRSPWLRSAGMLRGRVYGRLAPIAVMVSVKRQNVFGWPADYVGKMVLS